MVNKDKVKIEMRHSTIIHTQRAIRQYSSVLSQTQANCKASQKSDYRAMCLYNVGTGNEQNNQGSDSKLGEGAHWRLGGRMPVMDITDGMNLLRWYWLGSTSHRNQSQKCSLKWNGHQDEKHLLNIIGILMSSRYIVTPIHCHAPC